MEKTTVTVDYKRFRELEELEQDLKESESLEGVILSDESILGMTFWKRRLAIISGTEAITLLIKQLKESQEAYNEVWKKYKKLRDVTPLKYIDKAEK